MRTAFLQPDQIITLNDYPMHSDSKLKDYFHTCKLGDTLPYVPVLQKALVKRHFDASLLQIFAAFERTHPEAQYFMLDGSHRTTAATLTHCKISITIYETTADILEANKLVATGCLLASDTLNHTLEENCAILNRHFREKPYFMTVQEKTEKMIAEHHLPALMVAAYRGKALVTK